MPALRITGTLARHTSHFLSALSPAPRGVPCIRAGPVPRQVCNAQSKTGARRATSRALARRARKPRELVERTSSKDRVRRGSLR